MDNILKEPGTPLTAEEIFDQLVVEREEVVVTSNIDEAKVTGKYTSILVTEKTEKKAEKKRVRFNKFIQERFVGPYDRTNNKPWRKLSSIARFEMLLALNLFKRREMAVHEKSRGNTRYHDLSLY